MTTTWYVRLRPVQLSGDERDTLRNRGVADLGVMALHEPQWDEHTVPEHWEQSRILMLDAESAAEARQKVLQALQRDIPPTVDVNRAGGQPAA